MNTKPCIDVTQIPDSHLQIVNELLSEHIDAMGAYALGLMTYIGLTTDHWPSRTMLDVAAHCVSLQDALELYHATMTVCG